MNISEILALIDAELSRLQQAKAILSGGGAAVPAKRRGRPALSAATSKPAKKRNLSPEGRARIAEAVKRRWATQKAKQKKP